MLGVMSLGLPDAAALGYGAWLCGRDNQWAGQSISQSASTLEIGSCGSTRVRALYRAAYPGAPSYWTGWFQHASYAVADPSLPVVTGQHEVTSCGLFYDCGPHVT